MKKLIDEIPEKNKDIYYIDSDGKEGIAYLDNSGTWYSPITGFLLMIRIVSWEYV